MALPLTTTAFQSGGTIPKKFTCAGTDVSPELAWTDPPVGTKTFAVIVDDPDAPAGEIGRDSPLQCPTGRSGAQRHCGASREVDAH